MRFRRGLTLANGEQGGLIEAVNKLLTVFGLQPLPSDTDDDNLEERLTAMVDYVDRNKQATSTVAMANRIRSATAGQPVSRPPSDAEIERRLKARGIDLKFMPKIV